MVIVNRKGNQGNQDYTVVAQFLSGNGFSDHFKKSGFYKTQGVSPLSVFTTLITLVFTNKNWWRSQVDKSAPPDMKKDVVYRFLNNSRYNWEELLKSFASSLIIKIKALTNKYRDKVLIFDDTFFDRTRSKKVELLSYTFDHVDMKQKKGFLNLTCGWSDGFSFIPFMFQLVASKKILKEAEKHRAGSVAETRRVMALMKKTDLMIHMIQEAIERKIPFNYVLFDSWFSFPSMFLRIKELKNNAIGMLKNHPNIFYLYNGRYYRLSGLYDAIKKKLKKDRQTYSVVVSIGKGEQKMESRIVFIRDKRSRNNWLAILSSDITIDDTKIIEIYGMRWDIEVFFKMSKSYLKFAKEFQGRSFDMLVAHTTIVYFRYIMFVTYARFSNDEKTFGDLFYQACDDVKRLEFAEAFLRIMNLLQNYLLKNLNISEQEISDLLDEFIRLIPDTYFGSIFLDKAC